MSIAYTVAATFSDYGLAEEWLRWLEAGHIAEVLAGGASDAEIVVLDEPSLTYEVRYHFPSREAFANYEKEHAPRLRAEGLEIERGKGKKPPSIKNLERYLAAKL